MDFDTKPFSEFLRFFYRRKNNLLRHSNATPIKRVHVVTLDLSVQPNDNSNSTTINGNSLFKIPTNFTGLHIQQIYSTAVPTTSKTGQIYLTFDDNNIGNVQNSKLLQLNDSFDLIDGEVANGWLWWNNQADTTVNIAFFIDMDYRSGSQLVQNTGTVNSNVTNFPINSNQALTFTKQIGVSSAQTTTFAGGTDFYVSFDPSQVTNLAAAIPVVGSTNLLTGLAAGKRRVFTELKLWFNSGSGTFSFAQTLQPAVNVSPPGAVTLMYNSLTPGQFDPVGGFSVGGSTSLPVICRADCIKNPLYWFSASDFQVLQIHLAFSVAFAANPTIQFLLNYEDI